MSKIYIGTKMPNEIKRELERYGLIYPETEAKEAQGNGQGQCALCKKRNKWNVQWMCFLYKVEGKEGVYCKNCAIEIELQNFIDSRK